MKKRKRLKELNRMIECAEAEKARISAFQTQTWATAVLLSCLDTQIHKLEQERSELIEKIRNKNNVSQAATPKQIEIVRSEIKRLSHEYGTEADPAIKGSKYGTLNVVRPLICLLDRNPQATAREILAVITGVDE